MRVARARCGFGGRWDLTYLSPNLAIGGRPGPPAARRGGVDSVLDLTEEARGETPSGCEYLKMPVENGGTPTLEETILMIDWIHERIERGGNVLVHCSLGRGRATFVAACYLMARQNMTAAEAYGAVKSRRRYAHLNRRQQETLVLFEEKLRVGAPAGG